MSSHFGGIRTAMGVIIDNSNGQTIEDNLAPPTALVKETKPLPTQHLRGEIMARMAIDPAPRKSGTMGQPGEGTASDDKTIGPPDARITSRKLGLGGAILIGVAVLTLIMIMGRVRA